MFLFSYEDVVDVVFVMNTQYHPLFMSLVKGIYLFYLLHSLTFVGLLHHNLTPKLQITFNTHAYI